jgi:cold shock protein
MRAKGTVKWFDPVKGFGFLVVEGVGDVLLQRAALETLEVDALATGAILDVEIVEKPKGAQVKKILAVVDWGFKTPPLPAPPAKRAPRPREVLFEGASGSAFEAECKWFSRPKGYGMVAAPGSREDVFVHMDLLRKHGLRDLKPGQRVKVRVNRGPKGLTATAIEDATDRLRGMKDDVQAALRAQPNPGEIKTNVLGELLLIDPAKGFGIVVLPELDDIAFADADLLREAGATDPLTCGKLVCDVESAPPLLLVRRVGRVH